MVSVSEERGLLLLLLLLLLPPHPSTPATSPSSSSLTPRTALAMRGGKGLSKVGSQPGGSAAVPGAHRLSREMPGKGRGCKSGAALECAIRPAARQRSTSQRLGALSST